MVDQQQELNQLATMLKVLGQPVRIQLVIIIVNEQFVSIPTFQAYLPDIDPFVMYTNLRYMHKKHLLKKIQKGRGVYYGLSVNAISAGFDTFFKERFSQHVTRINLTVEPVNELPRTKRMARICVTHLVER